MRVSRSWGDVSSPQRRRDAEENAEKHMAGETARPTKSSRGEGSNSPSRRRGADENAKKSEKPAGETAGPTNSGAIFRGLFFSAFSSASLRLCGEFAFIGRR